MRTSAPCPSLLALVGAALLCGCGSAPTPSPSAAPVEAVPPAPPAPPPTIHTFSITSPTYHIDRKYASMFGPDAVQEVRLLDGPPELLWITGYETTVVRAEDEAPLSQEFMCHANLDLDVQRYYEVFPTRVPLSGRVFTLSQGQQNIQLPPGFGIPVWSGDPLRLTTQVLNLNLEAPNLDVKHRVNINYVRDSELKAPLRPLFQAAAQGFKALGEAKHYGVEGEETDPSTHGEGCAVGMSAVEGDVDADHLGQKFTAHWIVEPGREEAVTNVTRFLNLPYDTRAHYIAVHLHPFAESLSLRDRTTGAVLFTSRTRPSEGRVGIDHIDYFESVEGLPLYKDHEYELVSVYNNTTDQPVDSMAVMYLYLLDQTFGKPDLASLQQLTSEAKLDGPTGM